MDTLAISIMFWELKRKLLGLFTSRRTDKRDQDALQPESSTRAKSHPSADIVPRCSKRRKVSATGLGASLQHWKRTSFADVIDLELEKAARAFGCTGVDLSEEARARVYATVAGSCWGIMNAPTRTARRRSRSVVKTEDFLLADEMLATAPRASQLIIPLDKPVSPATN